MKKRAHKNTPRLTARERAEAVANDWFGHTYSERETVMLVQRAIASAVRAALARKARR